MYILTRNINEDRGDGETGDGSWETGDGSSSPKG